MYHEIKTIKKLKNIKKIGHVTWLRIYDGEKQSRDMSHKLSRHMINTRDVINNNMTNFLLYSYFAVLMIYRDKISKFPSLSQSFGQYNWAVRCSCKWKRVHWSRFPILGTVAFSHFFHFEIIF